jgi:hypothetical protein
VCAAGAGADTIYVDVDGGGDYTTIQAGMNAAASGDTVLVARGTYFLSSQITYGGKQVLLMSEYGPENTVIDCQGVTRAIYWDGEGPGAKLLGFTIQNGDAGYGGAVYCKGGAEPTISGCIIRNCSAEDGGGIWVHQSPATVWDTEITGCTATESGGGIYSYWAVDATFVGLVIGENTAADGGGMYLWGTSPAVQLCTLYRNSGSAIHVRGATAGLTILQTIMAFSTQGQGIACEESATPYVAYCDVYGNAGGDDICGTSFNNGSQDPRFCNMAAGDVTLCANSWCLPGGGNPGPTLIGARGEGCDDCAAPVAEATWGAVKALYR